MSSVKKALAELYDVIAQNYAYTRRRLWAPVDKVLPASRILDVGSGPGLYAVNVASRFSVDVVCMDISTGMLKVARRHAKNRNVYSLIHLVIADLEYIPFRSYCFDAVLCIATIHHLPTRRSRINGLREIARILKINGKALITAWNIFQPRNLFRVLTNIPISILKGRAIGDIYVSWHYKGEILRRFYHLYTLKELKNDAINAGLNIVEDGCIKVRGRIAENIYILANRI
ncbi:MAG: class I SAM-dependent methyltransferase [Candidatus Methanomethylicia archaeon]